MIEGGDLEGECFYVVIASGNFSGKVFAFVLTRLEITFKLGVLVLKFLYFICMFFCNSR